MRSDHTPSTAPPATDLTHWLWHWADGQADAGSAVFERVYGELVAVARRAMACERADHTLQPTALVHEVYLRLRQSPVSWHDRVHFFAVAAGMMRRILVDHARGLRRDKRGGGVAPLSLLDADADAAKPGPDLDLLALDAALDRLLARAPMQARMVELCYFGGLSYSEIAGALGTSRATVGRELRFAKVWLRHQLVSVA
ncbi:MAG: ECF-type sigma factor [Holophagales bacterium]|nr:ECF-type sigma factor [Holophagales bacterium]